MKKSMCMMRVLIEKKMSYGKLFLVTWQENIGHMDFSEEEDLSAVGGDESPAPFREEVSITSIAVRPLPVRLLVPGALSEAQR